MVSSGDIVPQPAGFAAPFQCICGATVYDLDGKHNFTDGEPHLCVPAEDAAKEAAKAARQPREVPPAAAAPVRAGAVLVQVSSVEREEVCWRWTDRLPIGKMTIIEGDPGAGKSFLALEVAAAVSLGAPLPGDSERFAPRKALFLTAEDGLGDTVRPRLEDMGANLTLITALRAIYDSEGREQWPSLARDLPHVEDVLAAGGYGLVIIDPINAYLGGIDGHRDIDVRSVLGPLAQLAERHGVAVVCIRHLAKGQRDRAIYRGQGSIAYTAAARSVLLVGQNPEDGAERVVIAIKHNLAADSPGYAFEITEGRLLWRGESHVTADALLAPAEGSTERSALEEAKGFLREALAAAPMRYKNLVAAAREQGISLVTLRRAKDALGVDSRRRQVGYGGGQGYWEWALPAQDDQVSQLGEDDRLVQHGASFVSGGEKPAAELDHLVQDGENESPDLSPLPEQAHQAALLDDAAATASSREVI